MKKTTLIMAFCLLLTPSLLYAAKANDKLAPLKRQHIPINPRIYSMTWKQVPFNTKYFTLTNAQLHRMWKKVITPTFRVPFITKDLLRYGITHYPDQFKDVNPYLLEHIDVYQQKLLDVMRNFIAGNFQQAYKQGIKLGALGWEGATLSEFTYAYYLAERRSVKFMMLQDIMNQFQKHDKAIHRMLNDPNKAVQINAELLLLGYAYATGRLAEEQPVATILARGYLKKIRQAVKLVLEKDPSNPLALALRAGISSDIIRRVGKFTGRVTYNAHTTTVKQDFRRATKEAPQALIYYEFANSLIYMNHKHELNQAMKMLSKAIYFKPQFAMSALDSMYAYKRLQEIRIYALDYRSFSRFDKDRRHFAEITGRNLTNVLGPTLTLDMLKHPEKYRLKNL